MDLIIKKSTLTLEGWKVNALCFIPQGTNKKNIHAIFCHGYTAHKGPLLTWGDRLAELGVSTTIFDLPGHYLGSYNEVPDFSKFKKSAHRLFSKAWDHFQGDLPERGKFKLVLGGHSLGALLALKALGLENFSHIDRIGLCVGLGLSTEGRTHILETPFFKKTMNLRSQLVSPELAPEKVFPWIRAEKLALKNRGDTIYLLNGEDDAVAPLSDVIRLKSLLEENQNQVTLKKVKRLPHHLPDSAAFYIKILLLEHYGLKEF